MIKFRYLLTTLLFAFLITKLNGQVILNMTALKEKVTIDKSQLAKSLREEWNLTIDESKIETSDLAMAFELEGEMVGIMNMDAPIPWGDLEGPCKVANNWPNAKEQLKEQKSHIITTVLTSKGSMVDRNKLLTKITTSIIKLTHPIGVYMGAQELVVSADNYVSESEKMKQGKLPVANWVLIGLVQKENKTTGFTIGLVGFGYKEFEIIQSEKDISENYELLYNLIHYVLQSNVKIKNGETIGYTQDQKIHVKLTSSKLFKGNKVILIQN